MLNLNVFYEGTCYENKDWRNQILFHTTRNCFYILGTADRIKYADEIYSRYRAGETDVGEKLKIEADLLSIIKIITSAENYFKAVILNNDCVIHLLNKNADKPLKKKQLREPVFISEIMPFDTEVIPLEGTFIRVLDNITINFRTIITSEKYLALINLQSNVIDLLKKLYEKRNSLHYLVTLDNEYSNLINLNYKNIKDTLENEFINLNETLGRLMNISEKAFLKNTLPLK